MCHKAVVAGICQNTTGFSSLLIGWGTPCSVCYAGYLLLAPLFVWVLHLFKAGWKLRPLPPGCTHLGLGPSGRGGGSGGNACVIKVRPWGQFRPWAPGAIWRLLSI